MQLELSGKKALVTGASRGIGRAIAEALHAEDCQVALNARDEAALDAVVKTLPRSVAAPGDVTHADTARIVVERAIAALGQLDILVCNVGSGRSVPPGEETPDEWQRVFAQNLWSATNCIEAARPALVASRGNVVCVSSICGVETLPDAPVTYSAAKSALNAYVRGLARPLGRHGVRINAVAPGNILFEGGSWAKRRADDPVFVDAMLEREVALRRFGTPQDVAAVVVFLGSAKAGFATGAVWTLDGGQVRS